MKNKNKIKIEEEYKRKLKKLLDFNKAYFEKDKPKVSDADFDNLKNELLKLSKKYPFLKTIQNIDNLVGYSPSSKFAKVKHSKPMLSLSNAFDKNDIIDFKKKN